MSTGAIAILLSCTVDLTLSAQITGWIYADNWFELYFNGVKVATDPLYFYPHNAVYVDFTAPDDGLYSFAIWTQDYANSSHGLEPRITPDNGFGGWCVGDGGITIALSDGTNDFVSGSDWMCYVVMEGPIENQCRLADSSPACLANNLSPNICSVQYNPYPSCWNETICSSATTENGWVNATEYEQADIGWGRSPNTDPATFGYTYPEVCSGLDATQTTSIYQTQGCVPADKDWKSSKPMWTSDLDYDNRIICRRQYCMGGNCDTSQITNAPTITVLTPYPSESPTVGEVNILTADPTMAPLIGPVGTNPPTVTLTAAPSRSPTVELVIQTDPPTIEGATKAPSEGPTVRHIGEPTNYPSISDDAGVTNAPSMAPIIDDGLTNPPTQSPEAINDPNGNGIDRLCIVMSIVSVLITMMI